MEHTHLITQFLQENDLHDPKSIDKLFELVFDELRRLARGRLRREREHHTLNATGLVHEYFIRLQGDPNQPQWQNRAHFYSLAVIAMKRILIEHARKRMAEKRGGGAEHVPIEDAYNLIGSDQEATELLTLNEALTKFGEVDPTGKQILEAVYFSGLPHKEIAQMLGVTTKTIQRSLRASEFWLKRYYGVAQSST